MLPPDDDEELEVLDELVEELELELELVELELDEFEELPESLLPPPPPPQLVKTNSERIKIIFTLEINIRTTLPGC